MDAPTDGFILPKKAKNKDAAKAGARVHRHRRRRGELPQDRPVGRRRWPPGPARRPTTRSRRSRCTAIASCKASRSSWTATPTRHGDRAGSRRSRVHRQPDHVQHQARSRSSAEPARRRPSSATDATTRRDPRRGRRLVPAERRHRAAAGASGTLIPPGQPGRRGADARHPVLADLAFIWVPGAGLDRALVFTSGPASAACTRAVLHAGVPSFPDNGCLYRRAELPPGGHHLPATFWPAVEHNLIWLARLHLHRDARSGMLFAVLIDRGMRGSRVYQSVLFLPVMLSLALIGIIWEFIYSPNYGLINTVIGHNGEQQPHRLARQPAPEPVGGAGRGELAAGRLRHGALPGRAEGGRPGAA